MRLLHLTALWAYGVSQPIFSLVEGNPSYLVLRDSTRADSIVFALVVTLGVPVAAVAYVRLAALLSEWVGDMLYLAMLAVFIAPLALRLVKTSDPGRAPALIAVCVLCAAGVASYVRWRPVQLFVGFSIVLPAMALISFIHGVPVERDAEAITTPAPTSRPSIVMVVFDEFPVSSLLTGVGRLDHQRFPAISRLAREGTWYPNATTVHAFTDHAVPAILTGGTPSNRELPILRDHPLNLFTVLGRSYGLRVHEETTRLCPERYCPPRRGSLLDRVTTLIGDIANPYYFQVVPRSITGLEPGLVPADKLFQRRSERTTRDFETFLGEFSKGESDTLHFAHVLLPHVAWRYLPTGEEYGFSSVGEGPGEMGNEDPWLVEQRLQRHLLQVGYADALVGRLLERLQEQGIWDDSLVIVVGDHGASLWPGVKRRDPTPEHLSDIASVPLFVKLPGQSRGSVDRRAARTTDVLPTILDVLGLPPEHSLEGVSLLSRPRPDRDPVVLSRNGVAYTASLETIGDQRNATARRNARWFGEGWDSLYRIGTAKELLGLRIQETWPSSPTIRVRIEGRDRLQSARLSSAFVPVHISGVVQRGELDPGRELAVAVNGRIRALTQPFEKDGAQRFHALVPKSALVEGANRVDVFAIESRRPAHLVWLGSS